MEGPSFYVEISVYSDDTRHLHCRLSTLKTLTDELEEMQGNRFELVLIQNRCLVGIGTYDYTGKCLVTEDEQGACVGFLDTLLFNRQEGVIEQAPCFSEKRKESTHVRRFHEADGAGEDVYSMCEKREERTRQ